MAIWTNGESIVIATGWGVARRVGKDWRVARFPRGALKQNEEPPALVGFAMLDDAGERALVQREREPVSLWTAGTGNGTFAPCVGADGVLSVASSKPGSLALLTRTSDTPARVVLRKASMNGETLVPGEVIALPAAARSKWKSGMLKPGEGWPEDREAGPGDAAHRFDPRALNVEYIASSGPSWRARATLHANRHGIGLASTYSGVVAVLDPDTLAPRFAVRVPTLQDQFEIFVLPLASGALVTLVANYRHAEFVLLDKKGASLAQRHTFGEDLAWGPTTAGIAWDDKTVLVNQSLTDDEIHALKLPDLAPKRHGKDPGVAIDAGTSLDGATHVIALAEAGGLQPAEWQLSRAKKNGAKWKSEALDMPDFKPPPKPAAAPAHDARRAEGSPSLGVIADTATPWRAAVGQEVVLLVKIGNRGGAVSGLTIEVAGDAVEKGLVEACDISLDEAGSKSTFASARGAARAEIPVAKVQAAYLPSPAGAPKPPPQALLTLRLRVSAKKPGMALMTVRVGPGSGAPAAGSGMAGRSFVVTENDASRSAG